MAATEKIKDKIIEQARLQAQSNIDKANAEADVIIKSAQKKAEQIKEEAVKKAHLVAANRKNRLISGAQLEARKNILQEKQNMIEETFNQTLDKITTLPAVEYQQTLEKMIINSIKTGNEKVIVSADDRQKLSKDFIDNINKKLKDKAIDNNISLSSENRETGGGFILKLGNIEINNSFISIIRMNKEQLQEEIVKILF